MGPRRQHPGDNGMFHGVPGSPRVPAHDYIRMDFPSSQSHPESNIEKVFIEYSAYSGGTKKLHVTLILLLER
jgi:hypothetical protein